MEITKPNDIVVALLNNPGSTPYDFISSGLTPENTSLYNKEEYKNSDFVKNKFKLENGEFDNVAFDQFYKNAENNYRTLTDEEYLKGLDEIMYSPFDVTRPKEAKTFKVDLEFSKDYNPFKTLYSRTGINSTTDNSLSLRELTQQNKIFDPKTNTWTEESANDRSLLDKIFGETLVYGQYDDDGTHVDPETGKTVKHRKGDWKIDENGNLFIEKLGDREIYGKQVVNPMDTLTTDGSFANKFDVFDSDNKEANALKTTIKIAAEIAPLLIPGVNVAYGGVRAAIGLSSALPTLYKSLEGVLLGDQVTETNKFATGIEGYLAKYNTRSVSDEAQSSMFNYEQMIGMVSDIFGQIFEQRAAASLSKLFYRTNNLQRTARQEELLNKINLDSIKEAMTGKIDIKDIPEFRALLISKTPGLQELQKAQSAMAKTLSLGYMALTSTADMYGQGIQNGYDRRSAGFAALLAAGGTYALMMNNRMGDWFLDKATGYTVQTNKALMRSTITEYMDDIQKGMNLIGKNSVAGKAKLAGVVGSIRNKMDDILNNPRVIGEAMWKNAVVEGVEEVTEQLVIDASKGITDTLSYLGLTAKQGSFGGFKNVFSKQGLETYLANLFGGVIGGGMFEFHRARIEPWLSGNKDLYADTKKSIYQFVANGESQTLVDEINKHRAKLGNNYISPFTVDGDVVPAEKGRSHADLVADTAIGIVRNIEHLMNNEGLVKTDEEIINKAIQDHWMIKRLEASKGESKIGIEGLIVDDFRKTAEELTKINEKIQKLGDDEANKENIKQLKEEGKIYRDKLNKIMSGELSEEYLKQSLTYLSKETSKVLLTVDRETFTKAKYSKSYYDLPNDGSGITKERVEKEWKEYLDNTDIKKNIEVATNIFFNLLNEVANPTADYIESGYAKERKKTIQSLLDLGFTSALFDTSEGNKQLSIERFIKTTKEIEERTGKRIIPWDVMKIDLFEKINNEGLFISTTNGLTAPKTYFDEKITIDNQETTKGEIVKNLLEESVKRLPSDAIIYDMIADRFNSLIGGYNQKIEEEIEKLNSSKTEENSEQVTESIENLENKKIFIQLGKLNQSQTIINNVDPLLLNKQMELNLYDNARDKFTKDSVKNLVSYKELLEKKANSLGKNISELSDDEILNAISEVTALNKILFPEDVRIENIITLDTDDKYSQLEQIIDSNINEINNQYKKYLEYQEYKDNLYKDNTPNLFNPTNYTIKAIVNEIKNSGNLDKELFLKIQDIYKGILSELKNTYFKGTNISDKDFLDLVTNNQEIYSLLEEYNQEIIELKDLPEYLQTIISSSSDPDEAINIQGNISNIFNNTNKISDTLNGLSEIKEILDNSDKFISNSLYDFLDNFELTLNDNKDKRKKSIFKLLKEQENTLFNSSDITNFTLNGIKESDLLQAIGVIKILRSVVNGLKTTEVDEPYGIVKSIQKFVERNKIESDISKIKTTTSDISELMNGDLKRIQNKLEFLVELSKHNFGKITREYELIRNKTNELLLKEWSNLVNSKPNLLDISNILNSSDYSNEKKLLEIETLFYETYKNESIENKINLAKELASKYNYKNILEDLYDKDNSNRMTKEIKAISNNDFLLYLLSSMSVNSKAFNNRLLNILNTEFDKAPFFTQELAAKITYASIVNPELFSEIVKLNQFEDNNLTDNIVYVLGNAGTGKTTVLFKLIVLMLKDNNPNLSIWFSAPHIDKVNELFKSVLDNVDSSKFNDLQKFDKELLFEKLGVKDIVEKIRNNNSNIVSIIDRDPNNPNSADKISLNLENETFNIPNDLPDLIFIDEVTHFEAWELEILNEIVKRVKSLGKNVRIITAGDQVQLGATSSLLNNISYNVDRVSGIFTPQLTLSVRELNSQKRENSDYLYALTKKSISTFENSKDSPIIMNFIGDGISLKHHFKNNILTGELITEDNNIPEIVLNILKNIVSENNNTKIGILSDTLEIDPNLRNQLESIGITENNYKVYTEKTIQGSEADYFIFPISKLKSKHILESLRKLYTYMSRSRNATIIVNDLGKESLRNGDGTILNINSIYENITSIITPLNEEAIKQAKDNRIEVLKQLLDLDFNIFDDYKFKPSEQIIEDISFDDNTFIKDQEEEKFDKPFNLDDVKDDFKYRVHTFYNDLNVKVEKSNNGNIKLSKNKNSDISYGLDFIFENEDSIVITNEEFNNLFKKVVNLKYKILSTYYSSKANKFKVPTNDPLLERIFGIKYGNINNPIESELVIRKSKYNSEYNLPQEKFGDIEENRLNNNDNYLNLFLKIKSEAKEYYIHLATLPKTNTVEKWNNTVNNQFTNSYIKYKEFVESNNNELKINPDQLEIKTSTRLIKFDDSKPIHTISDLKNIKGLKFWKEGEGFSDEPTIGTFPKGTEEGFNTFIKLYKKTTFGSEISNEKLREMFFGDNDKKQGYKGKPYIAVSFIENPSHVKFILLKSKTKSLQEVIEIINDPLNGKGTAKNLILSGNKEITRILDTLFSGNQVLDMLISLAVKEPDTFKLFFTNGTKILEETKKVLSHNQSFLNKYLPAVDKLFSDDLLSYITYSNKGDASPLRKIFEIIRSELLTYEKNGIIPDRKKLKEKLISEIKLKSDPVWWRRFWNLFSFKNMIDSVINNTDEESIDSLKEMYTEYSGILNRMIKFWENEFPNGIYYNVPLSKIEGTFTYKISDNNLNNDNLYVTLTPEGPYINIDLSKEVNGEVKTKPTTNKVKDELNTLKNKLSSIKYNSKPIISSNNTDTIELLNNKISRANTIKSILEHKNNNGEYSIENLINNNDIDKILVVLNSQETPDVNTIQNQISKLTNEESYKSELLKAFNTIIGKVNLNVLNKMDNSVLSEVIRKWNNKVFPNNSNLFEFLQSLPNNIDDLSSMLDVEQDDVEIELTTMIYDLLNIDLNDKILDVTTNLFNKCIE